MKHQTHPSKSPELFVSFLTSSSCHACTARRTVWGPKAAALTDITVDLPRENYTKRTQSDKFVRTSLVLRHWPAVHILSLHVHLNNLSNEWLSVPRVMCKHHGPQPLPEISH